MHACIAANAWQVADTVVWIMMFTVLATSAYGLLEKYNQIDHVALSAITGCVSILMAVRNKGQYINESLGSIFALSLPRHAYRVICVDDASTDNSREIIAQYQARYDNLEYYLNPQNVGTHMTRIRCVLMTRTQYLTWLDPDDFFVGTGFPEALARIQQDDVDLVEFGCRERRPGGKFRKCWRMPPRESATVREFQEWIYRAKDNWCPHRKVYVTGLYLQAVWDMPYHVRNARLLIGEDLVLLTYYMTIMKKGFAYIRTLGEQKNEDLKDSSVSEVFQPNNITAWQMRLAGRYAYDRSGRLPVFEILGPTDTNVSWNIYNDKIVEVGDALREWTQPCPNRLIYCK